MRSQNRCDSSVITEGNPDEAPGQILDSPAVFFPVQSETFCGLREINSLQLVGDVRHANF